MFSGSTGCAASLGRRGLVCSSVGRPCVVSPSTPVRVSRAALLRGPGRKPSSSGFISSSAAWCCAQAQGGMFPRYDRNRSSQIGWSSSGTRRLDFASIQRPDRGGPCNSMQYNASLYNARECNTMYCHSTLCNAMQHNAM